MKKSISAGGIARQPRSPWLFAKESRVARDGVPAGKQVLTACAGLVGVPGMDAEGETDAIGPDMTAVGEDEGGEDEGAVAAGEVPFIDTWVVTHLPWVQLTTVALLSLHPARLSTATGMMTSAGAILRAEKFIVSFFIASELTAQGIMETTGLSTEDLPRETPSHTLVS